MSPQAFDILRDAVHLARDLNVKTVATLRILLAERHPGAKAYIDEALKAWASYESTGSVAPAAA